MRLPALSVIILSLAIIWCVAGYSIHGPWLLLYPAAWLTIAAAFYFHSKKYPIGEPSSTSTQTWANAKNPSADGNESENGNGESKPQKMATAD